MHILSSIQGQSSNLCGFNRFVYVCFLLFHVCASVDAQTFFKGIYHDDNAVSFSGMIRIGGLRQYIEARGKDGEKPLLLILQDEPGVSVIPVFATYNKHLSDSFIVAFWDQRGTGKSFSDSISDSSMTLTQAIKDAHEVVLWLTKKFDKKRIILYGSGWGGALGTLIVHKYPELFYGLITANPLLNPSETMVLSHQNIFEKVRKNSHKQSIRALKRVKPPFDIASKNGYVHFKMMQKWIAHYGGYMLDETDPRFYRNFNSLFSLVKLKKAKDYSYTRYGSDMRTLSLDREIKKITVPYFLLLGRHDGSIPTKTAEVFYRQLHAPTKKLIWFEHSAHIPSVEQSDTFTSVLFSIAQIASQEQDEE